jgi:hypothetical protein
MLATLRRKREEIEEAIFVIEWLARDKAAIVPADLPHGFKLASQAFEQRGPKKRTLSPEGRKQIAAARRRWAALKSRSSTAARNSRKQR